MSQAKRVTLGGAWRIRMAREVVRAAGYLLLLTCLLVGGLTWLLDYTPARDLRLLSCTLVFGVTCLSVAGLRRRRFRFAVAALLVALYAGSAMGAIGTQVGVRAPSLLILSMFTLIIAFAFPRRVAIAAIGLNMAYLTGLFVLEKVGVIDPLAHLEVLGSTSLFIVLLISTSLFGAMGFPMGLQVDKALTRLGNSRSQLARSRALYRSLVEGAPIGVLNTDRASRVISANPTALQWLGLDQHALPKKTLADVLAIGPLKETDFSVVPVLRFDRSLPGSGGPDLRWLAVTVSPHRTADGSFAGAVVLLLDETIRKRGELELLKAKESAELAVLAKSRFLNHMSHELRTPMTGILGSVTLARDVRLPTERRDRVLGLLNDSARAMLTLLDDILDASRLSDGRLQLMNRSFDPQALLQEMTELYQPAALEKKLQWEARWNGPGDVALLGDPLRIRQVISNLVGNALRFTDHGQVGVWMFCSSVPGDAMSLRIEVRDTGIGLSVEQRGLLFEPFTDLGLKRAENQRGAGLGLSLSKGLVELMGGTIGLHSESGQGSVFWFELCLPMVVEQEAA